MSLATRVNDLATAVAQDIKGVLAGMGLLASLTTTAKSSLVAAINEVNAKPSGGESNTASNLGTVGEGVYASKSGVDLRFKKLNATGSASISSDATTITFSINETALQTYVDNAQGYALQAADEATAAMNWASEAQTSASQAQAAAGGVIDDAVVAALKAWSSEKVAQMLRGVGGGLVTNSGLTFNNMTQTGFFLLANVAGAPKATNWGWAVLNACDNGTNNSGFQIAIDIQTSETFRRVKFGSAGWLAWGRITMDLPQITVGTTAPASPAVGDLWVDTN